MIVWDKRNLDWYVRAGLLEPYAYDIADCIKEYIQDMDVVDAGCGPGVTSYCLAKHAKSVTGYDSQTDAIEYASKKFKDIDNLKFSVKNFYELEDNSCDVLCGISVGRVLDDNLKLLKVPKKTLILAQGVKRQTLPKKDNVETDEKTLIEHGIKYKKLILDTSFGQWFKSYEEGQEFLDFHELKTKSKDLISEFGPTKQTEYPLYLENKKTLEILIIEREEKC